MAFSTRLENSWMSSSRSPRTSAAGASIAGRQRFGFVVGDIGVDLGDRRPRSRRGSRERSAIFLAPDSICAILSSASNVALI